jgi:TetR/AcrR family transcriptional regulator, copper-responsive repressor
MVAKHNVRRRRGRPREYEPVRALQGARDAFWAKGFNGTSLPDLEAATGMNRSSLYTAFGDKRTLYLKVLDEYRGMGRAAMEQALRLDVPLAEALRRMYARALDIYLGGEWSAQGCFIIGTAATEAVHDRKIRASYAEGLHELDEQLERRFRYAIKAGELPPDADARVLALIACGIMNALAVRARAGDSRADLETISDGAVSLICGLGNAGSNPGGCVAE